MNHEMSLGRETTAPEQADLRDSDTAMAKSIAQGNVEEWDRFFHRYAPWAYRFAYQHLNRNHADAEDLCSDILMIAVGSIGKYDATRGTLDVWLLGIARHRLSRFCRRRHKDLPLIPEIIETSDDRGTDVFDSVVDEMLVRDSVNKALATLPERQASVLVYKYVEGYSTEEIARIGNTTPKAVESLLSRARGSLRCLLKQFLEIAEGGRSK